MGDPKSILITGCSDGGAGSALALAFHQAGWRVFASARNSTKLKETESAGIESIQLDVLSESSIQEAVTKVVHLTGGSLDALLNNAGAGYSLPFLDLNVQKVRELFELNVFSNIAMIQAFTPLLLKSTPGAMVINNTSIAGSFGLPMQSAYNASKAAISMFTSCLRVELEPLGIKVIDLKTGSVKTNFMANNFGSADVQILPPKSYYYIAKEAIEKFIIGDWLNEEATDRHIWAQQIVKDVSKKSPAHQIWRGASATVVWFGSFLYPPLFDSEVKRRTGLDIFEKKLKEQGQSSKPKVV